MTSTPATGDRRSIPDPSVMTTQMLQREISSLKELVFVRFDTEDRAAEALKELMLERYAIHTERFESVAIRFIERDKRSEQMARDGKLAIDAALQAAKQAVDEQQRSSALATSKSEAATAKQIDQIGGLIQSTVSAINSSIGDIKDRLTRIEGEDSGLKVAKTNHDTASTSIVSIIALATGTLIGLGGLAVAFLGHTP